MTENRTEKIVVYVFRNEFWYEHRDSTLGTVTPPSQVFSSYEEAEADAVKRYPGVTRIEIQKAVS